MFNENRPAVIKFHLTTEEQKKYGLRPGQNPNKETLRKILAEREARREAEARSKAVENTPELGSKG